MKYVVKIEERFSRTITIDTLKRNFKKETIFMRKFFTSLSFFLAVSAILHADPSVRFISFTEQDLKLFLSNFSSISLGSDSVYLYNTQSRKVHAWGIDDFRGIKYDKSVQDGIENTYWQSIHIENNTLYVEENSCQMAYLYSSSGQLIQPIEIRDGKGYISVTSLPVGVYVVIAGREILKMVIN